MFFALVCAYFAKSSSYRAAEMRRRGLVVRSLVRYIWRADVCGETRSVILRNQSSGEILKFPAVWLRDNCRCSDCFSPSLHSRIVPLAQFTGTILPKNVQCYEERDGNDTRLAINWPDKHQSVYELCWLRRYNFEENARHHRLRNDYKFKKITWHSSNFTDTLRYFSFEKLLDSDSELLDWLVTLKEKGVAVVQRAGCDERLIEMLVRRVGFIKKTTYGELFRVEADENSTNAAYRSTPLEMHVDLPYYQYCPSFIILHYVVQPESQNEGENHLVDGLRLCEQMKNYDDRMYETLANTIVEWTDISQHDGHKMHHVYRAPVICLDSESNVIRVNFSQHQRGSRLDVSIEQANQWYEAMNWFVHLAFHRKNFVKLKIPQGDMLTFDNLRVLHGRGGFHSKRRLIGAYMDADIVDSRIRILSSTSNSSSYLGNSS